MIGIVIIAGMLLLSFAGYCIKAIKSWSKQRSIDQWDGKTVRLPPVHDYLDMRREKEEPSTLVPADEQKADEPVATDDDVKN